MRAITASEFRANMAKAMEQLIQDHSPLTVTRQGGKNVVVLSEEDWSGIEETLYLLSTPENARALLRSLAQLDAGEGVQRDLIEP